MSNQFSFVPSNSKEFRDTAPNGASVFYRSYSRRKDDGSRENFREAISRAVNDIADIGNFTNEQRRLVVDMGINQHCFPSGRALWVAGTEWSKKPENFPGYYNCCSMHVEHVGIFGLLMELAMMGTGTGAVLEKDVVAKLPPIVRYLRIANVIENEGKAGGSDKTEVNLTGYQGESPCISVVVGDSRAGWASGYQSLIELATGMPADGEDQVFEQEVLLTLDLRQIRQAGEPLKGFGGVANPVRLRSTLERVVGILNKAVGRQLKPIECCLLIDEASSAVVAGNIRRCLPGSALVHTKEGLKRIADIEIGTSVQTSRGFRRVVDKFDQGEQGIYEITTQDGNFFCSKNHKVAVLRDIYGGYDMVKAIDLQPGDRMIGNHFVLPGKETFLPEFVPEKSLGNKPLKPLSVPLLNEEVAYLIGYLHGNGNVKSDGTGVRISGPAGFESIAERCANALKLFGFDSKISHKKNALAWELSALGRNLNSYFSSFKQVFSDPAIPDCILEGTEKIRWHYLAGLMDSDGTPSTHVLVSSSCESFCRQVQVVYSSLGIPTRLQGHFRKGKKECELNAVGLHKHKTHEVFSRICIRYPVLSITPALTSRNQHGFPKEMVKASIKGLNWGQLETQKAHTALATIEPATTELIPVSVTKIEQTSRVENTFDIEVEEIHEFYCDGYLVSNSAGMRQFSADDMEAAVSKEGLYKQDAEGGWSVDPEREALRMANHTLCYHSKPSLAEIEDSVTRQYLSGEGAIQYVPEMLARSNADLLDTPELKKEFLRVYSTQGIEAGKLFLETLAIGAFEPHDPAIIEHRITRYGLNPCAEINIRDNLCNLSEVHVNTISPADLETQFEAFYAGGLQVAALLNHEFVPAELNYSRKNDPIVGVSLTGGFDFFVHAFGAEWLDWMMKGRPTGKKFKKYTEKERAYLRMWRDAAEQGVTDYCEQIGIRKPNRCTTIQPAGSKSLLTGASPGWHPPKAQRFIRRITFGKNDPLAAALRDYGYNVIPAQSARDENGNLLNDINDSRVHEVLVEIPTEVSWANLPGCDAYDVSKLPIEAQWGLYMQFQNHYVTHNTSATLEFREAEIPKLAKLIYDNIQSDGGYISAALLARFDASETFPRLPFEPIDKKTYDGMMAQIKAYRSVLPADTTILDLLAPYDHSGHVLEPQDTACANESCLSKIEKEEAQGIF